MLNEGAEDGFAANEFVFDFFGKHGALAAVAAIDGSPVRQHGVNGRVGLRSRGSGDRG